MPQRLALCQLRPWTRTRGKWSPLSEGAAPSEVAVLPCRPVRLGYQHNLKTPGWPERVEEQLAGQVTAPAELRGPRGVLEATAVEGLHKRSAGDAARAADVDASWHSSKGLSVRTTDTDRLPARHEQDAEASGEGASLLQLLETSGPSQAGESVRAWTTASREGWRVGGDLAADCDVCGTPLLWFDWWHASAEHMRSSWLVACPEHGARPWERRTTPPLILSRRQLDSALWAGKPDTPPTHHCYVFDLHGLEPGAVYVGESWHSPQKRYRQHQDGENAASVLSKPGVSVGALRLELLPELPPLRSRSAARAAEQWCVAVLTHKGAVVHGGH